MPINPVQFAHQVCDEFLRYLYSAFPLTDPDLSDQFKRMLSRPSSLDIPLVQGPFVSLSEAFAVGDPVDDLAKEGLLHHALPGLIGYPRMWKHQQQVFEAVREGKHVLVSTGTGSGKTEGFLYPIVDDLLRDRDKGINSGLKAILVYPMNALANDQLDRMRELLAGTGITFGLWIGSTPNKEADVSSIRFEGSSRQAYLEERRKLREEAQKEDRTARPFVPNEECCSEADIRERQPRILLTNYRQLEILLTRQPDVQMFADAPLKYLVFDEAHTYGGAAGAEVACLIRRLRLLSNKQPDEVTCIGTSATLTSTQESEDDEAAAKRFASRFFGVHQERVALIGESYVQHEWPRQRYRPAPPEGDGMERLHRLLEVLTEPVDVEQLRSILEELTGGVFEPSGDWRESLHEHLVANEYVYQCAEVLKRAKDLDEGAWMVSQRVKPDRFAQGDQCSAEMLCYLALGAAAQQDGQSLIRPKVHFFIRGLDEMVSAFNGTAEETTPELFMSHKGATEEHADRHSDAFLPVLTCRTCGQHFFEGRYLELEEVVTKAGLLRGFSGGNAVEGTNGGENAFWSPTPSDDGSRLVLSNRLLEEVDEEGDSKKLAKWLVVYLCRQCGALHREPSTKCLSEGCGHGEPLLPLRAFGSQLRSCPSCGTTSMQIGGRVIEPIRPIRAITVADVHILSQAMLNAAPEGHEKLVIFADSRQDAAHQAGWMQDHGRRIRLRHLIYQIIQKAAGSLTLNDIIDHLMEVFRGDKSRRLVDSLLPELTVEGWQAIFATSNIWVVVRKALLYLVLKEFTSGVRRRDCLESMGLAKIEYEGLAESHPSVIQWAKMVGITPTEAVNAISLLVDSFRRQRSLFVQGDDVYSRYHMKDDPYIQSGLLRVEERYKPQGYLFQRGRSDKFARGFHSSKGTTSAQSLLKKWAEDPEHLDTEAVLKDLWDLLTKKLNLLAHVQIRSQRDKVLAEVWQVDCEKMRVVPQKVRYRCNTCRRVVPRPTPKDACTTLHCHGTTERLTPDEDEYDVWQMARDFTMVSPEEHTAQVPGEVREKIEIDFKSKNGRTNCLVATPTLEMGVNIGALDMVLMRNVPPTPSNYWQRAGRAGREERMAVIVAYCRRSQHDRYFFDDPLRLLDGSIEAPAFNLRNPLMVAKHVRSGILSELLLKSREGSGEAERTKEILKEFFPTFIRNYLVDDQGQFRTAPMGVKPLESLLEDFGDHLTSMLVALFAQHWPMEAADLVTQNSLREIVQNTDDELQEVLRRLHKRLMWAIKTRSELHKKKDRGLIEREEEQLLRRCDEFINKIVKEDRSTYSLSVLGNEGFLPGYGVYEGGVNASARRGFSRQPGPQVFDLSRNGAVALREFVPGNRIYANRGTFYVARYHLAVDDSSALQTIRVNPVKGIVTDASDDGSYGQDGGTQINALPIADLDLAHEGRITEDENLRFSMPVSVVGRLRKHNRGGVSYKIGDHEVHHLRGQGIELVNLGEAGRVRKGELGHLICTVCGAAKSPYAVEQEILRFQQAHEERCGREPGYIALTATVNVDTLLFFALQSEREAINLGESLRTAATRMLDMRHDDLELLLLPNDNDTFGLMVYDPMPGGSGLLDQMLERWEELVETAKQLLNECPTQCETACYACLKTFRNQFYHDLLNRESALTGLDDWDLKPAAYRQIQPLFEEEKKGDGTASNPKEHELVDLLKKHHFPEGRCRHRVQILEGMATTPDWLYEDQTDPSIKVAVYLDGMSRSLHGDPKRQKMDELLRNMMEINGYKVIIVQSKDLNDPEMMRNHLRHIAEAMRWADFSVR